MKFSFWGLLKGRRCNAARTACPDDVKQTPNGGGFHRFASSRDQVLADVSRVRVLAQAVSDELLRASQHGERASVRALTSALIGVAKSNGLYISRNELSRYGDLKRRRSGESLVFVASDDETLTKVKDPEAKQPLKSTTPADWMYEHVIHNVLFPEARYEFVGVTEELGSVRIVLQQRNIEAVERPSDDEIASALRELGLVSEGRFSFGNEVLAITDVGEDGDNVLQDENGKLFFIDPLVCLKRPATDVLKYLTGVEVL